jgi:hypothetical protein
MSQACCAFQFSSIVLHAERPAQVEPRQRTPHLPSLLRNTFVYLWMYVRRYRWSARGGFKDEAEQPIHSNDVSSSRVSLATFAEQDYDYLGNLDSETLRAEVRHLSSLVSRDFIESWFHEIISPDTTFVHSVKDKLQDAVANLSSRVLQCDMVALLFLDVAEAFRRLYGSFTDARTQVSA